MNPKIHAYQAFYKWLEKGDKGTAGLGSDKDIEEYPAARLVDELKSSRCRDRDFSLSHRSDNVAFHKIVLRFYCLLLILANERIP